MVIILLLAANAGGSDAPNTTPSLIRVGNSVTLAREPAAGLFLVARRELDDPHFAQSVIYLLRHGPLGTIGLIVNRPSGLNLSDTVSDLGDQDVDARPVYFGGPVEFSTVSMLIRNEQESRLVEHISDDVYLSGDRSVLDRLLAEKKPHNALHFYLGHAGWTSEQLALEIEREDWYVVDTDPAVIFSADSESIWKRLIEKLDPSGIYASSDWPADSLTGAEM
jgi:putative transcriptional regulator